MIAATTALLFFPTAILLLLVLYIIFVQHQRGPKCDWLKWVAIIAVPLDWFLNRTAFALLLWYWPTWKEVTFSTVIQNRQIEQTRRGAVFRLIARFLNWIDPLHKHIPTT